MNDVSCCVDISMEVLITHMAVEVLSSLPLSGGGFILYSYTSLSTYMTGLGSISWVHCPN